MGKVDWASHVEAQRRDGRTPAEYCRSERLNLRQFYYYRRKLSGRGCGEVFVEIGGSGKNFELLLKCGSRIMVPEGFNAASLSRLIEVLSC